MEPKFYLTSFIACFLCSNCFAQKKQNVYFLKDDGRTVPVKDSADFIRIVQEPDSGTVFYNVLEYYPNGNKKFVGKSSSVEPVKLEGTAVSFYPNKNRKQVAAYEKGLLTGDTYDYYPNGKLYRVISYEPGYGKPWFERQTIKAANDSIGNETVKEGNGHYVVFDNDYKNIYEEGEVKDGKRNGTWKGKINISKLTYTEDYDKGKFVKGASVDVTGKIYNYKEQEVLPKFPGGEAEFGKFLSKNIRYPKNAYRNNIQDRVILSFVVEKDGIISDLKVLRSIDPECSAEALRVLSQSPKWNPGIQHGVPVRVAYTMPINFALGR